jgi:hypothetical protein
VSDHEAFDRWIAANDAELYRKTELARLGIPEAPAPLPPKPPRHPVRRRVAGALTNPITTLTLVVALISLVAATVFWPPVYAPVASGTTTSTTSGGGYACTNAAPTGTNYTNYSYSGIGCPVAYPTQWTDTANLTGSNFASPGYPYTGYGAYWINTNVWGPICATSSGATTSPSSSNCVTPETSTLQANSGQNWVITTNAPVNSTNAVTAYPNAATQSYSGPVDGYTSLTSSYNQTMPVGSSMTSWAMVETYYTAPGHQVAETDYEVSIQVDFANDNAACPATLSQNGSGAQWNYGIVANDVNFGGTLWHLCDGQANHQSGGACPTAYPYCGQLVWKQGCDENARPVTATASGTVDIKAMVQWLEDNDAPESSGLSANQLWGNVADPCSDPSGPVSPSLGTYASYPYLATGSSVSSIALGWEVVTTSALSEVYSVSHWGIAATGAPAPCADWPGNCPS